jgi:hypothetical protein
VTEKRWIKQFDKAVRDPILTEMDHVLKGMYLSKAAVMKFLAGLVKNEGLATADPCSLWRDVAFRSLVSEVAGKSRSVPDAPKRAGRRPWSVGCRPLGWLVSSVQAKGETLPGLAQRIQELLEVSRLEENRARIVPRLRAG